MPEELVVSWISLISLTTGITSIVLAIFAIIYAALNDIRNRTTEHRIHENPSNH